MIKCILFFTRSAAVQNVNLECVPENAITEAYEGFKMVGVRLGHPGVFSQEHLIDPIRAYNPHEFCLEFRREKILCTLNLDPSLMQRKRYK